MLAACLLAVGAWTAMAAPTGGAGDLLARAETLYLQRGDLSLALQAADAYRQVLEAEPANLEAGLRATYLLVWVGANHEGDDEAKYVDQALTVAQGVAERHPDDPGARYWLGVCYGLAAMHSNIFSALSMADKTETEMRRVLAMDPSYDFGGAWRVLGRLYDKMPMLLGGDEDQAERMYAKALDVAPSYPLTRLYLADLRAKQGREQEARKLLRTVLDSPDVPGLEPECQRWREVATRWLAVPQMAQVR